MINEPDKKIVPFNYSNRPSLDRADIVIIGNGIAGLTAAVEARHLAPDKRIVIVSDQIHPTINTPALKQFAIGKLTREQLLAYPAGTERAERIHVVQARVEEIHAQSKYISLNGKRGFGYDTLLLATGSSPQGLPEQTPGRNFDGVLVLHRLQDFLDLRRRLSETSEAVVVGGGVHAIETVMGLLHWGIRTHWLIRGKTFMRQMLDEAASEIVLNTARKAGALVYMETEVAGIIGRVGAVAGIITNQNMMLPCQLILTCTGTRPSMSLAQQCSVPMLHKNGILVDDKLRTSVRDIYAAGDVAALKNPQTGVYGPRAQWYAAVAEGRIAGSMMVGQQELAKQPFGVPWHATHLGDLSMLTVGEPLSKDTRLTVLTDTSQGGYRKLTTLDDRLVGYLSLGSSQPDSLAIKRIIDEGTSIQEVIKPLLKGQFDARSYLARQRSRVTRNLLSGKLPALLKREEEPNTDQLLPMAGYAGQSSVAQLSMNQPPTDLVQQTGPIESQFSEAFMRRATDSLNVDEFNPFTGNLPLVVQPDSEQLGMITASTNEPASASLLQRRGEPITPFPDHALPVLHISDVSLLAEKKSLHYKLWAYIDAPLEYNQTSGPHIREGEVL